MKLTYYPGDPTNEEMTDALIYVESISPDPTLLELNYEFTNWESKEELTQEILPVEQ
jgi:hypothetical protein